MSQGLKRQRFYSAKMHFGPNLELLTSTDGKLWHRKLKMWQVLPLFSGWIWSWRSMPIALQINRDVNWGVLHIWA